MRAVAGTAFRAPTFNDLYFPGFGVRQSVPSGRAASRWRCNGKARRHRPSATLYRNRVRDLIAYESIARSVPADPAYDFGCAATSTRRRCKGDLGRPAIRTGAIAWRATIDFLDAKDDATGERLPRPAPRTRSRMAPSGPAGLERRAELLRVGSRPEGGAQLPAYLTRRPAGRAMHCAANGVSRPAC
jgi:vitamin B12 transporter